MSVGYKELEELEKRLYGNMEQLIYKSHLSIKEVDSGLHQTLLKRLDKQDEILEKVVEQNDEMYKVLTTSKTLWDAVKIIGGAIIKVAAVGTALLFIKGLYTQIK